MNLINARWDRAHGCTVCVCARMKMTLLSMFVLLLAGMPRAGAYEPLSPAGEIDIARYDWHDTKRDRAVPAKLYSPKAASGPRPIVIFAHGLGGSREM